MEAKGSKRFRAVEWLASFSQYEQTEYGPKARGLSGIVTINAT